MNLQIVACTWRRHSLAWFCWRPWTTVWELSPGNIGTKLCDICTELNLHNLRLWAWDEDPTWNKWRAMKMPSSLQLVKQHGYLLQLQRRKVIRFSFFIVRTTLIKPEHLCHPYRRHSMKRGGALKSYGEGLLLLSSVFFSRSSFLHPHFFFPNPLSIALNF